MYIIIRRIMLQDDSNQFCQTDLVRDARVRNFESDGSYEYDSKYQGKASNPQLWYVR